MHAARIPLAAILGFSRNFVAPFGHLLIAPLPEGEREGDVHQGSQEVKARQFAREIPKCSRPRVPISMLINQVHLLHHLVVSQIWKTLCNLRIMERKKDYSPFSVPFCHALHLRSAELAFPVVNQDVCLWELCGRWKGLFPLETSGSRFYDSGRHRTDMEVRCFVLLSLINLTALAQWG